MAKGIHPFVNSAPRPSSPSNNNTVEPKMSSSACRTGLTLPLNHMALPIYTAPPSREDVDIGGQLLFQNFVHEEFEHEGVPDSDLLAAGDSAASAFAIDEDVRQMSPMFANRPISPSVASTPDGYKNAHIIQTGSKIRELAEEFAASRQRPLIKQQADQLDLSAVNVERFWKLLEETFKDGISKHCLIALFFFCSDVLIRCVKLKMIDLGTQLFQWSLQFIVQRVCSWVYANGGWEKVFKNAYNVTYGVMVIAALVVAVGCGVVYIKKNWRS